MMISMFSNFFLSSVFLYGVTGRSRLSLMSSLIVIPATLALYMNEGIKDFDLWIEARNSKSQPRKYLTTGVTRPQTLSKYDWSKHEDYLMAMLNNSKNEKESTSE